MNQTLSTKERLQSLDSEIANQEPLAQAERAFAKANSDATANPWRGASEELNALRVERDDLLLQERGKHLNALLAKRAELRERLDRLSIQRKEADLAVAERAQHESVVRYRNAATICIDYGWGHSFYALFRPWFESGRSLREGAPECATFFLHDEQAKAAEVQFDIEGDRSAVRLWIGAVDTANKVASEWSNAAEEMRILLQEHPELQAAS